MKIKRLYLIKLEKKIEYEVNLDCGENYYFKKKP